jgi:hypothetical protein
MILSATKSMQTMPIVLPWQETINDHTGQANALEVINTE